MTCYYLRAQKADNDEAPLGQEDRRRPEISVPLLSERDNT